jgi:hypothetical protein
MTAIEALIARMVSLGLGAAGVTIFAGTESDLPLHGDGFYTIIETGGRPPIGTHNEGHLVLRRPSFQVTARAQRYMIARNLAGAAMPALTMTNVQIGDLFFLDAKPAQDLFSLPLDGNERVRVAFNLETTHR